VKLSQALAAGPLLTLGAVARNAYDPKLKCAGVSVRAIGCR